MMGRSFAAAGVGVAALALATSTVSAAGGLRWSSPKQITSGVPAHVASIDSCPPVPTPGDTLLVQVTLSFSGGGASGQLVQPNSDGSWAGDVTFNFSGVGRRGSISAECLDYNGVGATPYAQYAVHRVALSG